MVANTRRARVGRCLNALIISMLALALAAPAVSAAPRTKLMSRHNDGSQAALGAGQPVVSGDGKVVAFHTAEGLVPTDSNGWRDVYARHVPSSRTMPISRAHGVWGNDWSQSPAISDNGRFVSFYSAAKNLPQGTTTPFRQHYRRDRVKGRTIVVSRSSSGALANGHSGSGDISASGRFVVFSSLATNLTQKDTKGRWQIYLRDVRKNRTYLISRNRAGTAGNGDSGAPAISPDGRFIVYDSLATNLSRKDERGERQVFMYDRRTKRTTLVSRNKAGKAGNGPSGEPAISRDGKVVVFASHATNLIGPGRDSNGEPDIYRRVRGRGKLTRVSLNWRGRQLIGVGCAAAGHPDISADGRYLVFESDATNVVKSGNPGDNAQVYRRDLKRGKVVLVSRSNSGARGNGFSKLPAISADGRFVVFESQATNLLKHDINDWHDDVFRRGPY